MGPKVSQENIACSIAPLLPACAQPTVHPGAIAYVDNSTSALSRRRDEPGIQATFLHSFMVQYWWSWAHFMHWWWGYAVSMGTRLGSWQYTHTQKAAMNCVLWHIALVTTVGDLLHCCPAVTVNNVLPSGINDLLVTHSWTTVCLLAIRTPHLKCTHYSNMWTTHKALTERMHQWHRLVARPDHCSSLGVLIM